MDYILAHRGELQVQYLALQAQLHVDLNGSCYKSRKVYRVHVSCLVSPHAGALPGHSHAVTAKATLMHEFKRCPRRMGSDSKVAVVVGASKGVGLAVWSHAVVLPLHPIRTNMCASLHK